MLISYRQNFIFIHNYKVAGTSITKSLKDIAIINPSNLHFINSISEKNKYLKSVNHIITNKFGLLDHFHHHASALEVKNKVPSELWNRCFKFSFVRNPWDLQVSLYHYMKRIMTPQHFQYEIFKQINTFEDYIEWRINEDLHLQKEMICDEEGNPILDFVGKFENLNSDYTKIIKKIGFKGKLPHFNKTNHKNYRKYYNEKTKRKIAEYYQEDIKLFNYKF